MDMNTDNANPLWTLQLNLQGSSWQQLQQLAMHCERLSLQAGIFPIAIPQRMPYTTPQGGNVFTIPQHVALAGEKKNKVVQFIKDAGKFVRRSELVDALPGSVSGVREHLKDLTRKGQLVRKCGVGNSVYYGTPDMTWDIPTPLPDKIAALIKGVGTYTTRKQLLILSKVSAPTLDAHLRPSLAAGNLIKKTVGHGVYYGTSDMVWDPDNVCDGPVETMKPAPEYTTNCTSLNDAIKTLQQKGILTPKDMGVTACTAKDMGVTACTAEVPQRPQPKSAIYMSKDRAKLILGYIHNSKKPVSILSISKHAMHTEGWVSNPTPKSTVLLDRVYKAWGSSLLPDLVRTGWLERYSIPNANRGLGKRSTVACFRLTESGLSWLNNTQWFDDHQ